ncbi:MAG: NERD domain-containing protein [Verrucomicrobiales bacterium]|nr:NERD domain-containing protein [Verrucomicrobiales bacterium]
MVSELSWGQFWGVLVGGPVFVGLGGLLYWWDQRRRHGLHERPPQQEKLLRPAGHSSMVRLDALWDRFLGVTVLGAGAGMILGIAIPPCASLLYSLLVGRLSYAALQASPGYPFVISTYLFTVAALLIFIPQVFRLRSLLKEQRSYRLGLRGEQAVAEALASPGVTQPGYVAFHDVPGSGDWNVDHVVVGPGGVFVLETKTRVRRKSTNGLLDHEVAFDGRTLRFPWGYDSAAVEQVRRNAEWVREFLTGFGPKDLVIQPVIVVPGWFVRVDGCYPVKVMNARYLAEAYLPSAVRRFSRDQLEAVMRRLDDHCRTVEF